MIVIYRINLASKIMPGLGFWVLFRGNSYQHTFGRFWVFLGVLGLWLVLSGVFGKVTHITIRYYSFCKRVGNSTVLCIVFNTNQKNEPNHNNEFRE